MEDVARSPEAPELCSAAADAMKCVGDLADCTLVAADGSSYKVSKGLVAAHSRVLGCVAFWYCTAPTGQAAVGQDCTTQSCLTVSG
jgi:hypothetical protein